MAKREFDMKSILDIPLWEKLQDQLAQATGTAIICIDYKGNPVSKHSGRTEFCSVIRENSVSRKRCFRCDALAGLEAVRLERPYIYLCHCGIVDVAVPVMVGDRYLGAVMFGQVRIPSDDADSKVVRLVNEISSFQAESESVRKDLLEMYERLPEMEYKRIVEIANLINAIVKYTVERAVKSRNRTETHQWLMSMNAELAGGEAEIQELYDPITPLEEQGPGAAAVRQSSVIYPAVAYINEHPREAISMKDMANLCHLSPSYFSRMFNREIGDTFTNYVNRLKIELAKDQLRNTNKSVSRISGEVGYLNVSNFIDVFKRLEGITPSVYRQHMLK